MGGKSEKSFKDFQFPHLRKKPQNFQKERNLQKTKIKKQQKKQKTLKNL